MVEQCVFSNNIYGNILITRFCTYFYQNFKLNEKHTNMMKNNKDHKRLRINKNKTEFCRAPFKG